MPSVHLLPLGVTVQLDPGQPLGDVLFPYGVEFPCGGAGRCRGCRVRVLAGNVPVTADMEQAFSRRELAAGWRLACQAAIAGDVTLEVAQWETPVLTDAATLAVEPGEGFGLVIDVGTTTIAAQLVDLASGNVMATETALNAQAVWGADVMTRIENALSDVTPQCRAIRRQLGTVVASLLAAASVRAENVTRVLLGGNTVMHHLFGGLDVSSLAAAPFTPARLGPLRFSPAELEWTLPGPCEVEFLPCLGGFVGSDILAGIIATNLDTASRPVALIDLGTNGEIVVADSQRLCCASTAAGPAFEAGLIQMGMRAAAGAIDKVAYRNGGYQCHTIGGVPARGICGSGLASAIAAALGAGDIQPSGRLRPGLSRIELTSGVALFQSDIRQLQLAKAAVAAGVALLAGSNQPETLYLAGAFGNYLDAAVSARIGLTPVDPARIEAAGNTALRGLRTILLAPAAGRRRVAMILRRCHHFALHEDARFEDAFVAHMAFPA